MGRLTKRGKTSHENGVCCTHFNSKECKEVMGDCAWGCKWEEEVWSKLASYEDAEEQGLLLHLPCKVGDKVYAFDYTRSDIVVVEEEVEKIHIRKEKLLIETDGGFYSLKDFGKIVFLTKAEAEKALADM